jgi:hypothetical protein
MDIECTQLAKAAELSIYALFSLALAFSPFELAGISTAIIDNSVYFWNLEGIPPSNFYKSIRNQRKPLN